VIPTKKYRNIIPILVVRYHMAY